MVVVGLGVGLVMQVLVVAVQNSVPYEQLGTATATATFFRTIGGAFGVSALNAVFNNRLFSALSTDHLSTAARHLVSGSSIVVNPATIYRLAPAVRAPIVAAFSHSLQIVFLVAVPFAALAFALSWLIKEIPLRTTAFNPPTAPDRGANNGGESDNGTGSEVAVEVATF